MAADHVEDGLLAEHDLEERVLVEQEDVAEDLIEVVEPLHILQVLREHVRLTNSEDVEKLLDVVVVLDGSGKLFPPQRRRQAGRHQFRDLLKSGKFSCGKFNWRSCL